MRLVNQVDYRGHTLLRFEQRIPTSDPPHQHWLVIGRDGVNIVGPPTPTEADARALVDRLIGPDPAGTPHQPGSTAA